MLRPMNRLPQERRAQIVGLLVEGTSLRAATRLATAVQLTPDGHKVYLEAVEGAFGSNIDYAMLVKMYEGDSGKSAPAERRYSPAICTGSRQQAITADPDPAFVSTSFVERQ